MAPSSRIVSPFSITLVMMWQASAAYSSGWPSRDGNGTCLASEARTGSGSVPSRGVSKIPGAIVTTRTPSSARSRATGRVMPTMPPLDAEYAAWPICPSNAATEAVLMTTPRSPSRLGAFCAMWTAASRMQLKVPIRFTVMTRVNSSSFAGPDLPSVFMAVPMPAQFTSTLMAPSRARAASRAPATSSALVTSAGVNTAASPSDFATSAPGEAGRSRMAMRAPAPASRAAVARPRPDAPPVTTARTDASSMDDPPRRNGILGTDIMRTAYNPAVRRRILCVYPAYARSFGTFQHAYGFFGGRVRAFMPPQGLLAVAAYLPASWEVRFADENSCAASDDDFRWADAVFISGMHIQ